MAGKNKKKFRKKNSQGSGQQKTETKTETTPKDEETKKGLKAVPVWKDKNGNLLKLKRASFPYNKAGNLAYCDYRIEYWKQKKIDFAAKGDPLTKLDKKRKKLMEQLMEVNQKIAATKPTTENKDQKGVETPGGTD